MPPIHAGGHFQRMKKKVLRGVIIFCLGTMRLCAGCGTFRWGERTPGDWAEITADEEYERNFLFKPTRDLKDPRWTMAELTSANSGFNLTGLFFFDPIFWDSGHLLRRVISHPVTLGPRCCRS